MSSRTSIKTGFLRRTSNYRASGKAANFLRQASFLAVGLASLQTLLLPLVAVAQKGPTQPLRDIFVGNPTENGSSYPLLFAEFDDRAYFAATDEEGGTELWHSDGSREGTHRLADLCPGNCSAGAAPIKQVGNKLFFVADDGVWGSELWTTDGTPEGTQRVSDAAPGLEDFRILTTSSTLAYGNLLLFVAVTDAESYELWRSDGTDAGTYLVRDIWPGRSGAYPGDLTLGSDGLAYFTAYDEETGRELWHSDGTFAGTQRVLDLWPGPESGLRWNFYGIRAIFPAPDGRLLLAGDDGTTGEELWISDGTTEGTNLLKDIQPGTEDSAPLGFFEFGTEVYFRADDGETGSELWATDGTPEGTQLVADANEGPEGSYTAVLAAAGDTLLLTTLDDEIGAELWRLEDGALQLVRDIWPGPESSSPAPIGTLQDTVYFIASDGKSGAELWRSDGTTDGTIQVKDIFPGSDGGFVGLFPFTPFVALDHALLFAAQESLETGVELWASDGTKEGTVLVLDILQEVGDSRAREFVELDGQTLFSADDGLTGSELWTTDGTENGTQPLIDLYTGESGSSPRGPIALDGQILFTASDGLSGSELWKTDGTAVGTVQVADIQPGEIGSSPRSSTPFNNKIAFVADDGSIGRELWVSDGTESGTQLTKDLWDEGNGSSDPNWLTAFEESIYFEAKSKPNNFSCQELWKSDGTFSGTTVVRAADDGGPSKPERLEVANSLLFFAAEDGDHDRELWRSDGTRDGTFRVIDLDPAGDGIVFRLHDPPPTASLDARLLFAGSDGILGEEIWESDGTEEGTRLLADISPGEASGVPRFLTTAENHTYFVARDPKHGEELWVTDGTAEGTHLASDIRPGAASSRVRGLTPFRHLLYFTATDGTHGVELWRSDGTPDGTFLVEDIRPGELSSNPGSLAVANDRLYFSAVDPELGGEPRYLELLPTIQLSGPCEGPLTIELSGLTPDGRAAVLWSFQEGADTVPRGRCSGTKIDLEKATVLATPTADSTGRAQLVVDSPGNCNRTVQAVDRSTCFVGKAVAVNPFLP